MPIIFIEFARQRDFFKASLLLLIGIFLIMSFDIFQVETIFLLVANSLLITLLVAEVFTNRWTQLSEKEKQELITIQSMRSKFFNFLNALKLSIEKFYLKVSKFNSKENKSPTKKWVRRDLKDSNQNNEDLKIDSAPKFVKALNIPKKDIIKDEKI